MIPVGFRFADPPNRSMAAGVLAAIAWVTLPLATAASAPIPGYPYVSPMPGARLVSPWNNIVLRPPAEVDASSVHSGALSVMGARSGLHAGRFEVSDDRRTLVFTPDLPFLEGESVSVSLAPGIRARDGAPLPAASFAFTVTPRDPRRGPRVVADEVTGRMVTLDPRLDHVASPYAFGSTTAASRADSVPPGMPNVSLMACNHPDPGDVFLASFTGFASPGHLMIVDNAGQPVFYRQLPGPAFDFKRQPNGQLTYFFGTRTFWALDSSYAVVDSFRAGNGYTADLHDFQLLPNGHALMLIYDTQPVPMDTIVPGARAEANVIGLVVQELDQAKNVVFQWRSWDHYAITDADTCMVNMRDTLIDYVHANAVELDTDGSLLVSARSMHEITKIDRTTGDIIWRWGMYAKNNQFTFVDDPMGFAGQHDVRRLPNGNITLFDNGNCTTPPISSRGVEYQLDEVNKIATLVREFRQSPDVFTPFMGNVQRREDGGTMVGWGGASPDPKVTDFNADGSVGLSLGFGAPTTWTYRAFRFPWQTSLFQVMSDSVDFGDVRIGQSATRSLVVRNRSTTPLTITSVIGRLATFSVASTLPLTIPPGETDSVEVRFFPTDPGSLCDTLYVRSVGPKQLVAQAVPVFGTCSADGIWIEDLSAFEGHSYRTQFMVRLRIAAPRPKTVSVQYHTVDGTARTVDGDYVSSAYRVFIAAGDTETWAPVPVRGDHDVEPDETFKVVLSNPLNAVIDRAEAVCTILDDDRLADAGGASLLPLEFALYPPNPNPGRTGNIRYDLPRACRVRIEVFDASGRRIDTLVDSELPAGRHQVTWRPRGEATGMFFYQLRAADFAETRKLVLIR